MPAPSRKTPQQVARMLSMHQAGASAREIEAELKLGHGTARLWLEQAGLTANGGHGSRRTRARHPPSGDAAVVVGAQQTVAEVEAGMMPLDRVGALAHLTKRLKQVGAIAEKYGVKGVDGTVLMADLDKAIKLEQALCTQIAELSPPKPPDPEQDPANLEAAAEVRRKLQKLLEPMRKNATCAHCGKNPFQRGTAA